MNDYDLTTLRLGAFRYYMGRRTYAVSDLCDLLSHDLFQKVQVLRQKTLKF